MFDKVHGALSLRAVSVFFIDMFLKDDDTND